jgi:hypothetical protein
MKVALDHVRGTNYIGTQNVQQKARIATFTGKALNHAPTATDGQGRNCKCKPE